MTTTAILFPFGVRLSTWLAIGAFSGLAVSRRSWRPILAGWAWIWGFEAAYDATQLALGKVPSQVRAEPVFYLVIGAFTVAWMTYRARVRPSPLLVLVVPFWVAWIAIGYHTNLHTLQGLDPLTEALNESAKTVWALAYLVPFFVATEDVRREAQSAARAERSRVRPS